MKKFVFTVFLLTLFFVSSAFSADMTKIGIFDFQRIIAESSGGKMIQKQITEKGNELQNKLKTEKDQLDEINKAYEREKLVLSQEKQEEKEKEFRARINDFKIKQDDFAREFKQLEIQLLNQIQEEIFNITTDIGKEGGYLLILERKAGGVLYYPDQLDITEQIINKYNLKTSKTN